MKISKYIEARILCGLAIVCYPFIRLFEIIEQKICKENKNEIT